MESSNVIQELGPGGTLSPTKKQTHQPRKEVPVGAENKSLSTPGERRGGPKKSKTHENHR